MKIKKPLLVIIILLAAAPVILTALVFKQLPAQIAMSWNINNIPEYSDKSTLWIFAIMQPVIAALLLITPKIDPRKQNYEKFKGSYIAFIIILQLFLLMMTAIVIYEAFFPNTISIAMFVLAAVGVLFMFLGNMLPKIKSNFYMGIRTPWTISDSDVWFKTNRLAGFLMFISGIIIFISAFVLNNIAAFIVTMLCVAISCLIPTVMSYLWYRNKNN